MFTVILQFEGSLPPQLLDIPKEITNLSFRLWSIQREEVFWQLLSFCLHLRGWTEGH